MILTAVAAFRREKTGNQDSKTALNELLELQNRAQQMNQ